MAPSISIGRALAKPGPGLRHLHGRAQRGTRFATSCSPPAPTPETPVVIVENGTLPDERAVATRLAVLDRAIAETGIKGPAIIFVGLDWASAGLSRARQGRDLRAGTRRRAGRTIEGAAAAAPAPQG